MGTGILEQTKQEPVFRSFQYNAADPQIPNDLIREMARGTEMIELDERLFYHIKFFYRNLIFFEKADRFGIKIGSMSTLVAEFFKENDRYFLRPPGFTEN